MLDEWPQTTNENQNEPSRVQDDESMMSVSQQQGNVMNAKMNIQQSNLSASFDLSPPFADTRESIKFRLRKKMLNTSSAQNINSIGILKHARSKRSSVKCVKKNIGTSSGSSTLNSTRHPCSNCSYVAKRKYTLQIHEKQHCEGVKYSEEIKNKMCRICSKRFTHDGLRSHLRGFINNYRKIRDIHSTFTVQQHESYLNEIKLRL